MNAAQGIVSALYERTRTGYGQKVDVALFDSVMATLCYLAQGYLTTGEEPRRLGNRHPSLAPYETFESADGYLTLAVGNDSLWQRFCQAVDQPGAPSRTDRPQPPQLAAGLGRVWRRDGARGPAYEPGLGRGCTAPVRQHVDPILLQASDGRLA